MARDDTKAKSKKSSGKTATDLRSDRRNDKPYDTPIASRSKSSIKEKATRLPEVDPVSNYLPSPPRSEGSPASESAYQQNWARDPSVHQSTHFATPSNNKAGPRSASSSGSPSHQDNTRHGVSSHTSSFGKTMSEPTKNGAAAETQREDESLRERQALDLRILPKEDFWPGRIVAMECYQDGPLIYDGKGPKLTREEFFEKSNARKRKIERFAIIRAYSNYSVAVCIHTHGAADPSELNRNEKDQAIIYSGPDNAQSSTNPPANSPIQVEAYDSIELPVGSRLNYAKTFTIEHNLPVAFVGQVSSSCWPSFATSYQEVQKAHGRAVLPLTPPTVSQADPSHEFPTHASRVSSLYQQVEPIDRLPTTGQRPAPGSVTREIPTTSSAKRISTAGGAGWSRFTSNVLHDLPRYPDRAGTRAEMNMQTKSNQHFAGISMTDGWGGINSVSPQLLVCSDSDENIEEAQKWIDNVTSDRETMMATAAQSKLTIEPVNLAPWKAAARRVKVAILDTAVNFKNEVFTTYKERLKEYKDFGTPPMPLTRDSHATHITSMLLHVAPEADIYVGQVCDSQLSLIEAILHATEDWEVDVINISLTERVFDIKDGKKILRPVSYYTPDHPLVAALAWARYNNIAVFVSAHNEGPKHGVLYPARSAYVFPVFSMNHNHLPSDFTPDAIPGRMNLGALGESIKAFWMEPHFKDLPESLPVMSGASFAAPIAAGIWASTLLLARLIYDGQPEVPFLGERVVEELLLMMSDQALDHPLMPIPTKHGQRMGHALNTWSIQPHPLWTDPQIIERIKEVFRRFSGRMSSAERSPEAVY